jgi:hypothetical protein
VVINQKSLPFDDVNVATKINDLLQRCDRIRRGSEITRPHLFDERGERHARQVAQRDQLEESSTSGNPR